MRRILLIEDDPDVAALVDVSLEAAGLEFTTVADGDSGLRAALESQPDLIILDWMLPGLSGLDICLAVRSDPRLDATPILMLTAKARPADVERARQAGADDYLFKPFSPKELASRVQALLRDPNAAPA
ncbi:response regulator [Microbacterium sp. NPDC079995]|uniref:response regulator transcription factor n=1 Tax=unclassified Microbacterium TaxID=2609290 RepID=UPI00344EDE56